MKQQMNRKIRLTLNNIKAQGSAGDSSVVLDIQKSLQFQMDRGLKEKMQQSALASLLSKRKKQKESVWQRCKRCPTATGVFVNSKYIQTLMFIITLYALIGDDIKLLAFTKQSDDVFMWLNIFAIIMFTIELVLSSIGMDGYFGSFFFWLDLVSTISIVTDIEPVWNRIIGADDETRFIHEFENVGKPGELNQIIATAQERAGNTGTFKAGRLARIVRLIRLIRIVKLYKSANLHMQREETRRAIQELAQSQK